MLVGINYPWINYGWDFGDPPPAWVAPSALASWREDKRRRIRDDVQAIAATGISVLRWFLLADGANYGIGSTAPQWDAVTDRWQFRPLPAWHPFYRQLGDDFEFVLQTVATAGIRIVPSLIDFHWCAPAIVADARTSIVKGGRADVVLDPAARETFLDEVLEPLLAISLRYSEAIYAWELINEPEWVTSSSIAQQVEEGSIPTPIMQQFIDEGVGRINRQQLLDGTRAFRSTVGFAHWDTLYQWNSAARGVTLHQFHYYAQEARDLPLHRFSPEYPCFVGEFATAEERSWPDLRRAGAPQTVIERLRCIERKGYPAAFLWSVRAHDPATRWTQVEQDDVASYLRSAAPDSSIEP